MGVRASCSGSKSDIQPADVPVAQLYDAFSPLVPLSLEGYGFCARGEGGAFTDDGALEWPNGRLPTNTVGRRDVRGVRARLQPRARRRAPVPRHVDRQVADAESCLVTSGEGVPTSAVLFRR